MGAFGPDVGSRAIGIDVGATNACVAVASGRDVAIIPDAAGERIHPAVVALAEGGALCAGAAAQRLSGEAAVATGFKRLLGQPADSPAAQAAGRGMTAELVRAADGAAAIRLGARVLTPVELHAEMIRYLRDLAAGQLEGPVTHAVLTVPGWFDAPQRRAVIEAARAAGLASCALVSEPAAAAVAYGVHQRPEPRRLAVVCCGGGGLDVAIVRSSEGLFEVLGAGSAPTGGEDLVTALVATLLAEAERQGLAIPSERHAVTALRAAAAAAIPALAAAPVTYIDAPVGAARLRHELSRAALESLARPLLEQLEQACQVALDQAGLTADYLDEVLLVGGLSRMPAVEGRVRVVFGRPLRRFNTGEVVAAGAATLAAVATNELEGVVLIEAAARAVSLRIEGGPRQVLVAPRTPLPARGTRVIATTRDEQDTLVLEIAQGDGRPARLVASDLPQAPAGVVRVQVAVTLSSDGLLAVAARETRSGRLLPLGVVNALAPAPDQTPPLRMPRRSADPREA